MVGGSAAGLFAALQLARAGRSVGIFEREASLAPALRTLIVTHRIRNLLGPVTESSVVNEIHGFELFTDGRSASIPLENPDLVVERSHLVRGLAEQARGHGARIHTGWQFSDLQADRSGIRLAFQRTSTADGHSSARALQVSSQSVIGADGAQSRVAAAAGWPTQKTLPLLQAIVKLPAGMPRDVVRVWFIPNDTPYFYWLIPESAERGALGLIGEDGRQTRLCLEGFLEARHFRPLSFQGARIPLYSRWVPVEKSLGGGRVYLVGDAAGQVKVSTVGGVVTGFRGALGVSEAILHGGHSPELAKLRRELNLHLLIRRSIHHFEQRDYSRLVDWLDDRMRRSLGRITRDEAGRILWHLCRIQPRLLLIGLRGLLTQNWMEARSGED